VNDPENIVAAIYRAVDWINSESKLALLVAVVEGDYRSTQRFVQRALLNRVYRKLWNGRSYSNLWSKKEGIFEKKD
jgi:hypothetical protein